MKVNALLTTVKGGKVERTRYEDEIVSTSYTDSGLSKSIRKLHGIRGGALEINVETKESIELEFFGVDSEGRYIFEKI